MRLVDADRLYEQTAEWESRALAIIEKMNSKPFDEMDASEIVEWRKWSCILTERSAFKHDVFNAPTVEPAPRWHRVEDGLPEMSEIVPGFVCSEILVLCDAKSGHMDIGYVREKPNGVDWLWGEPFKNPTHWMPIKPPTETERSET